MLSIIEEETVDVDKIKEIVLCNRTQAQEIILAVHEKRQPSCVHCEKPLEVRETQSVDLEWKWDKKKGRYVKHENDGDSMKPECASCETKDWDLTNNKLVRY